jgi:hypothetical protein
MPAGSAVVEIWHVGGDYFRPLAEVMGVHHFRVLRDHPLFLHRRPPRAGYACKRSARRADYDDDQQQDEIADDNEVDEYEEDRWDRTNGDGDGNAGGDAARASSLEQVVQQAVEASVAAQRAPVEGRYL